MRLTCESVFETLHAEPTVYFLPEYEDPSSQHEVLDEFWPILFGRVFG